MAFLIFCLLLFVPLGVSAASYFGREPIDWQRADRSSMGELPPAAKHPEAVVRVFAARTARWRGIFAVHSWIVIKDAGAPGYTRYDYTAWGDPIRVNGFVADGLWFGHKPEIVAALDGEAAARAIPKIRDAVGRYKYKNYGDYRLWPGPNSNTFTATILQEVPEIGGVLPPTAIGKDYPYDGRWVSLTPSRTGFRLSLAGYLGLQMAWTEGVEVNFLGAVLGFDVRDPAIKLPGIGRIALGGNASA